MNIFVPIPVTDTDSLYLRTAILTAEDDDTGITYDLSQTGASLLMQVTYPDGTTRKQIMEFKDLVSAWAVALEVDAEKAEVAS